ncbi:MAG TPA: hypothetical protein VFY29_04255 [Terriglobia bacterium]|nr:hypothetical protein [Terriglobia bacterium]
MNEQPSPSPDGAETTRWSPVTRTGFRFLFLYLALFLLVTFASASGGDSAFQWAQILWILVGAAAGALVWSLVDRNRDNDLPLWRWFTLFVRVGLGGQMLYYGVLQTIPAQFSPPSLVTLVTPVGQLSMQDLLWTSIGSSPTYQIFTGLVEVLAGALLLIPATAALGAIISFAAMTEILVMNVTYDAGFKLLSFHLLLMSAILLAPLAARVAQAMTGRGGGEWRETSPFRSARARRLATGAQIAFGVCLAAICGYVAHSRRSTAAEGRSPLYGIWDIRRLTLDGQTQPTAPDAGDRRWRRMVLDTPRDVVFQFDDGTLASYPGAIDTARQTLSFGKVDESGTISNFTYRLTANDRLVLVGSLNGAPALMELDRVELDSFRLLGGGLRWIRPADAGAVAE